MTLEELNKEKEDLIENISELVHNFEVKTKVEFLSINYKSSYYNGLRIKDRVEIKIQL